MAFIERKIIRTDKLPKGFIYFSDTHIVEGTGNVVAIDSLHKELITNN